MIRLRNLFSTRIALRLDEFDQVDMVLGDGASPDPGRVRGAYVTDVDIHAMAAAGSPPGGGP